jgi:hypothetical protein
MGALGCSRLDLALQWADTAVLYGLEDYFEIDKAQRSQFKKDFNAVLLDVQANDFSQWADFLKNQANEIENESVNRESLVNSFKKFRDYFKSAAIKFEPLIQNLIDKQAAKKFELFDAQFLKKYNTDLENLSEPKNQTETLKKRFDTWIDFTVESVTKDQKKSIQKQQTENPLPQQLQLESRKAVFEKFKATRTDAVQRKQFINSFFANWDSLQSPEYVAAKATYENNLIDWLLQFYATLNKDQKKTFIKNLRSRADQLIGLSAKAKSK